MKLAHLSLLLWIPCAAPSFASAPSAAQSAGILERVLDEAVARAQAQIEEEIELWEDHSSWENPWQVESEHYSVRTTHSHYLGRSVANGMETMLGHFQNVLGSDFVPEARFPIDVLPDLGTYNAFGNEFGAEHSSFYGSFYAAQAPGGPVAALYHEDETLLKMWVTHSALHQYVDRAFGVAPPTWLSEGLASCFAFYWAPSYGAAQLQQLIDEGGFAPLTRLIAADLGSYSPENASANLTELGMLVMYLLHYREDTLTPAGADAPPESFAGYLRLRLSGRDTSAHPVHALFLQELQALEEDFRACRF